MSKQDIITGFNEDKVNKIWNSLPWCQEVAIVCTLLWSFEWLLGVYLITAAQMALDELHKHSLILLIKAWNLNPKYEQ